MTTECEYNHRNWDFVKKPAMCAAVVFHRHLLSGKTTSYATKQEAQPAHNWENTFLEVQ